MMFVCVGRRRKLSLSLFFAVAKVTEAEVRFCERIRR